MRFRNSITVKEHLQFDKRHGHGMTKAKNLFADLIQKQWHLPQISTHPHAIFTHTHLMIFPRGKLVRLDGYLIQEQWDVLQTHLQRCEIAESTDHRAPELQIC